MSVYKVIAAVMADMAKVGISKDRKNQQQGYSFRGIDDIYNALSTIMSTRGLCVLPRVIGRECIERQTKSGSALFYVTLDVEFDFVCADDGSKHVVKVYGEAMDSADKATNKAMSAAYKYACLQVFCIPTEGDNDADTLTHDAIVPENKVREELIFDLAHIAKTKGDKPFQDAWKALSDSDKALVGLEKRNELRKSALEFDKDREQ